MSIQRVVRKITTRCSNFLQRVVRVDIYILATRCSEAGVSLVVYDA